MDQAEREERIEFIMDHYEDPRNYGRLEDADAIQKGGNPGCADIIVIYLKVGDDGLIEAIRFEGEGCTLSMAAASIVMEMVEGKTLDEIKALPHDTIIDILGREIALTRPRCSTLGLNTVRLAIEKYRQDQMLKEIGAQVK